MKQREEPKTTHRILQAVAALAVLGWSATATVAEAKWQKPFAMECDLEPGGVCNVEAVCPEDAPFVVAGGGGFP